jgi:hypothetical protein
MNKFENQNYIIEKCGYFIKIINKWTGRIEVINKRIANTNIFCKECEQIILKDSIYIRDSFKYHFRKKYFVSFICLNCWKGEIPNLVSSNFSKQEKILWIQKQKHLNKR